MIRPHRPRRRTRTNQRRTGSTTIAHAGWRRPSVWIAVALVVALAAGVWIWRSRQQAGRRADLCDRSRHARQSEHHGDRQRHAAADAQRQHRQRTLGHRDARPGRRQRPDQEGAGARRTRHRRNSRDQVARSRATVASATAKVAQTVATVKEVAEPILRVCSEVARLSGGKVPSKTELDAAQASFERAQADEAAARAVRGRCQGRAVDGRDESVEGVDPVADRRHRADAHRRSRQCRRRVVAGGHAVHDCRRPDQDEAAGQCR